MLCVCVCMGLSDAGIANDFTQKYFLLTKVKSAHPNYWSTEKLLNVMSDVFSIFVVITIKNKRELKKKKRILC